MLTELIDWLNASSGLILYGSIWMFLFVSIGFYRKTKSRPFISCIFLAAALSIGWAGVFFTAISQLLIQANYSWISNWIQLVTCAAIPLGSLGLMYTSWDVVGSPKNKNQILLGFGAFSAIYYIVYYVLEIYISPGQVIIVAPNPPPNGLYDDWINPSSIFYYFLWAELLFIILVTGIGFLKFMKSSPGALRRKALYIVMATLFLGGGIIVDLLIPNPVIILWITRLMVAVGPWFMIAGYKPLK